MHKRPPPHPATPASLRVSPSQPTFHTALSSGASPEFPTYTTMFPCLCHTFPTPAFLQTPSAPRLTTSPCGHPSSLGPRTPLKPAPPKPQAQLRPLCSQHLTTCYQSHLLRGLAWELLAGKSTISFTFVGPATCAPRGPSEPLWMLGEVKSTEGLS